jgi:hypothetical protein
VKLRETGYIPWYDSEVLCITVVDSRFITKKTHGLQFSGAWRWARGGAALAAGRFGRDGQVDLTACGSDLLRVSPALVPTSYTAACDCNAYPPFSSVAGQITELQRSAGGAAYCGVRSPARDGIKGLGTRPACDPGFLWTSTFARSSCTTPFTNAPKAIMQFFKSIAVLALAAVAAALPTFERRAEKTNFYLVATPTKSAHPANTTGIDLFDPYYQGACSDSASALPADQTRAQRPSCSGRSLRRRATSSSTSRSASIPRRLCPGFCIDMLCCRGILSSMQSPAHDYTDVYPYESNIDATTGSISFMANSGTKGMSPSPGPPIRIARLTGRLSRSLLVQVVQGRRLPRVQRQGRRLHGLRWRFRADGRKYTWFYLALYTLTLAFPDADQLQGH